MNNNLHNYFLCLLASIFLTSCVETVIPPWNLEQVQVMFSVITPGKSVVVFLSNNESVINSSNALAEAHVFFSSDNTNWYELEQSNSDSLIYVDKKSNLKIEAGKTYYLKAVTKSKTLFAKTTVPLQYSKITHVNCLQHYTDSLSNRMKYTLQVKYTLSTENQTGCYLTALGMRIGLEPYLSGDSYSDNDFYIPKDSTSFNMKIITVDTYLKKFETSQFINNLQFYEGFDINAIIANYGGVRPNFSNIENGVGLFGSFVSDSFTVNTLQR